MQFLLKINKTWVSEIQFVPLKNLLYKDHLQC